MRFRLWIIAAGFVGMALVAGAARADDRAALFDTMRKAQELKAKADFDGARGQYEDALRRAPKILAADSIYLPRIINDAALFYHTIGDVPKALELHQQALQLREAHLPADHGDVAQSQMNLSSVYQELGEDAKAVALLDRALKTYYAKHGPFHDSVAMCLNNRAIIHVDHREYAAAEKLYESALKIYEKIQGPENLAVAETLNNLANVSIELHQAERAEQHLQRSLKIMRQQLEPDHPNLAAPLNSLGRLYMNRHKYALAEPPLLEALRIREQKLGPDHYETGLVLNTLGALYNNQRQFARAQPLFERSLKIYEAQLDPQHPHIAFLCQNLGILHSYLGHSDEARKYYQRCLAIREAKFGPDSADVASVLHSLGTHQERAGQTELAAATYDRNRRLVRRHVATILPMLSEQDQLEFLENADETTYFTALGLGRLHADQPQLVELSLGWLLNGKAVAQESLAESALLVRDTKNPELADKAKTLLAVRTELAGLTHAQPKAEQAAAHRKQVAELTARERELTRLFQQQAERASGTSAWVESTALRAAIPRGSVFIDIVKFQTYNFQALDKDFWQPPRYVAWLTPPAGQGAPQIVDLGPADAIDAAVERARATLATAGQADSPLRREGEAAAAAQANQDLAAVAELVWKPLAGKIGAAEQLILSPDGLLWLLPWAALPVGEQQCLIERHALQFVISGRDLVRQQAAKQSDKRLKATTPAIFADPDFDLAPPAVRAAIKAVLPDVKFDANATRGLASKSSLPRASRLPFTALEGQAAAVNIEAHTQEKTLNYTASYALETIAKRLTRPRLLLFATHGFFLPDQEQKLGDKLPLASSESKTLSVFTTDGKPVENPLLRCGLLLAGCNTAQPGTDDGILTGLEIVGMDLRGTELVVLSACETGIGKVRNGEGVAGLRQAFQLAGAQSVVSTLWTVPDRDSALIMQDFFTNLAAGQSKAEALRNAQLKRIAARKEKSGAAHPFFWAAWTVTGD